MALCFLHSATVQTGLVRLATDQLSLALNTHAEVGHIQYRFPARLEVSDIYLEDQQGDTLAYIGRLYAHFSPQALKDSSILFRRIDIDHVRAYVHKTPYDEYNYQFLIDAFRREDRTTDSTTQKSNIPLRIRLPHICINDIRGHYDDHAFDAEALRVNIPMLSTRIDSINGAVQMVGVRYRDFAIKDLYLRGLYNDTILTGSLSVEGAFRNNAFLLSTEIDGRIDSLHANSLTFYHNNKLMLDANLLAVGLPRLDSMYVRAECRELTIRPASVQDMVSSIQGRPFRLSPEVHRLGEIHYRGLLDGTMARLKLKGAFTTAQGSITTDATFSTVPDFSYANFKGRIATHRFNLGRMLNDPDMGNISLNVSSDVRFEVGHHPVGVVNGGISAFHYRKHDYSNLNLNADFSEERKMVLDLSIDDEHGSLTLCGDLDWTGDIPKTHASMYIRHFQPGSLNLSRMYEDLNADMSLHVDIEGDTPDNWNGSIVIDSISLQRPRLEDSLLLHQVKIEIASDQRYHHIMLTSDVLTGRVEGVFDYTTLPSTVMKLAVTNVPGLFSSKKAQTILNTPSDNRLDAYLYGHEWQHLQYILGAPFRIGDYPVLKLFVNEAEKQWGVQGYISEINTITQQISDITLSANNIDTASHVNLSAALEGGRYTLHSVTRGDSIDLNIYAEGDSALVGGNFHMLTHITQYRNEPMLTAHIGRSHIIFKDSIYRIAPSTITYSHAERVAVIDHFRIGTRVQFIEADGIMSPRLEDVLHIHLGNIRSSYPFTYVLPRKSLAICGLLNGNVNIYGALGNPMFEADLKLLDGGLNDVRFGDAKVQLALTEDRKQMLIEGQFMDLRAGAMDLTDSVSTAYVTGLADFSNHQWGIDIRIDSLPMQFIGHWTPYLVDYTGYVTGDVAVKADGEGNTFVLAKVLPHDATITVPYTGCTYHVNDSCFLDSCAIRFPNLNVRDDEGNILHLDGILHHKNFKDFRVDIHINTDKALVVDLPLRSGDFLQGRAYIRGNVDIVGGEKVIRLEANATTAGHSTLRLALANTSNAAGTGLVTFVDHNNVGLITPKRDYSISKELLSRIYSELPSRFDMGLNLEITPEMQVQLVLNERTGDMIEARGEGAIQVNYNDVHNEFNINGTYTLESGKMGFTLANTFRRNFIIDSGSTIIFSGAPENPELDVKARYRVTASIKDLFGSDYQTVTKARTSIPVDVCIFVTGKLNDPIVKFGIELPSADDAVRAQVSAIVNTEEMLMRQVVYLVVFSRFYTPEYLVTTSTVGVNESFSLLSSTITGQINSWLGKLTDRFSLGVNIRNENGIRSDSEQEYEALFQITPIDRILINGNFGYRYSQISNQPFFGDLDVEFLLTEDGKIRLKGFTHMIDKYSLKQNNTQTIQGVGFVFKYDF